MAIYGHTGICGSGKTFYCMIQIYNLLKTEDNFLIVHNIDGFKTFDKRVVNKDFIDPEKPTDMEVVFNSQRMFAWCKKMREVCKLADDDMIYFYIDEAQLFFPTSLTPKYHKDVFFFFQYHRHEGLEIHLMTQDIGTIHRQIKVLCESITEALPRSIMPGPFFRYNTYVAGTKIGGETLRERPEIFKMYKSMKVGKKGKKDLRIYVRFILTLCATILLAFVAVKYVKGKYASEPKHVEKKHVTRPVRNESKPNTIVENIKKVVAPEPDPGPAMPLDYLFAVDRVLLPGQSEAISAKDFLMSLPEGYTYAHVPFRMLWIYEGGKRLYSATCAREERHAPAARARTGKRLAQRAE